jgi:hypothetical protein
MNDPLTLQSLAGAVTGLAALQFLVGLWLAERLKAQLALENEKVLEALRWENRVREQAAKVAEYLAELQVPNPNNDTERFQKLNRLSWELALWLPTDVYRTLGQALVARGPTQNELTVLMQVRRVLLGTTAGDLTSEEVVVHREGAGNYRNIVRGE